MLKCKIVITKALQNKALIVSMLLFRFTEYNHIIKVDKTYLANQSVEYAFHCSLENPGCIA